ncbi:hypothetical protein KI387_023737, partial [Taxus chinensis]
VNAAEQKETILQCFAGLEDKSSVSRASQRHRTKEVCRRTKEMLRNKEGPSLVSRGILERSDPCTQSPYYQQNISKNHLRGYMTALSFITVSHGKIANGNTHELVRLTAAIMNQFPELGGMKHLDTSPSTRRFSANNKNRSLTYSWGWAMLPHIQLQERDLSPFTWRQGTFQSKMIYFAYFSFQKKGMILLDKSPSPSSAIVVNLVCITLNISTISSNLPIIVATLAPALPTLFGGL